jgi:hypothetical protein
MQLAWQFCCLKIHVIPSPAMRDSLFTILIPLANNSKLKEDAYSMTSLWLTIYVNMKESSLFASCITLAKCSKFKEDA